MSRVAILAPGIAQANDQLHDQRPEDPLYFFVFLCRLVLVGLALLDDFGLGCPAGGARAASAAGAATSSTFGMTTWTSIVSGRSAASTSGLGQVAQPDRLVQHQLADVDVDVLRDVGRQALHLDLARDEVEHAALELDALRLAVIRTGTVTVIAWSIASW